MSVSLLSLATLLWSAEGWVHSVLNSKPFLIEEIEVTWPDRLQVPAKRYRVKPAVSIFYVDLTQIQQALQKVYPSDEIQAVRRMLPNHLVAELKVKEVVAQIRVEPHYYPVSAEGTIVAFGKSAPVPNLPILFLEKLKGPFRVGENLATAYFWKASELLAVAYRRRGIQNHAINSITCRDSMVTLILDSGLEVRFQEEDLEGGWNRLKGLIAQRPELLREAQYVDLRFEDPVIGKGQKSSRRR